nr:similar to piggyBac-derived 2 (AGAP012114-PA) [Haemonchus contortus]
MSIPDIEMEDYNESFDNWLHDSDNDAAGGLDGDDIAPAVVPDIGDSDTEISDDDYDEGAENVRVNDAQRYDRWTLEPVGTDLEVDNCETRVQLYELLFPQELLDMVSYQTNVYGQQKHHNWTTTDTDGLRRFFDLCLQMSRCPFDNQRNYWSLKPRNFARNGHSIAGDSMTRDRFEEIQKHLHFVDNTAALQAAA